jgi:predicted nucleotidyltransferase
MRTTKLPSKEIMATLKDQRPTLRKLKVRRIGLFGSYVRGEQGKSSDIDFLVEFEEPNFDNFMELVFYLENLFAQKVDLITSGSLSPHLEPFVEKEVVWYEVR